jgi:hypothetical protein
MLLKPELFKEGFLLFPFKLDDSLNQMVEQENWPEVDQFFLTLTKPGGAIFNTLQTFHSFTQIETMISIRNGENEWEEDGIWHDDGSRVFAFSLSLNVKPELMEGGSLELRRKNQDLSHSILTPPFGTAILFLTGVHGYEHRTRQVLKGRRIMLVGWCS